MDYKIRKYLKKDKSRVIELLKEHHSLATDVPFNFSPAHVSIILDNTLEEDSSFCCFVLEFNNRVCGCLIANCQWSDIANVKMAKELSWYIAPEARGKGFNEMLKEYEKWAKEKDCSVVGISALATYPRVGILYKRQGFKEADINYMKVLN